MLRPNRSGVYGIRFLPGVLFPRADDCPNGRWVPSCRPTDVVFRHLTIARCRIIDKVWGAAVCAPPAGRTVAGI